MTELLPCPFCGKAPHTIPSGEGGKGLMIDCFTEGCVGPHTSYYNHATAIRVWNTRAIAQDARTLETERNEARGKLQASESVRNLLSSKLEKRTLAVSALEAENARMLAVVEAAKELIAVKTSTFKARNGREIGIEADDGEKCYIVHSDQIFTLESALSTLTNRGEGNG